MLCWRLTSSRNVSHFTVSSPPYSSGPTPGDRRRTNNGVVAVFVSSPSCPPLPRPRHPHTPAKLGEVSRGLDICPFRQVMSTTWADGLTPLLLVRHWRWRSPQEGMMGPGGVPDQLALVVFMRPLFRRFMFWWALGPPSSGVLALFFYGVVGVSFPRVSGVSCSRG